MRCRVDNTYSAGEVDLHCEDTDILWAGHVVCFGGEEGHRRDSHWLGVGQREDGWRDKRREWGDYIGLG